MGRGGKRGGWDDPEEGEGRDGDGGGTGGGWRREERGEGGERMGEEVESELIKRVQWPHFTVYNTHTP